MSIAHRDLTPRDSLLARSGGVQVLDFGLTACVLDLAALQFGLAADAAASELLDRGEMSLRSMLAFDPEAAGAHDLSAFLHVLRGRNHEREGENDRARSE